MSIHLTFIEIIENIASLETKCFYGCFKDEKYPEVGKRMGGYKRKAKYFDKNTNKIKENFYLQDWSQSPIDFLKNSGKELKKYHRKLKEM